MAKAGNKANAAASEGFTDEQVMGELSGKWVTPAPGTVIEGKLTRAFVFTSDNGRSAAYAVMKDGADEEQLFSEKAAFADSLRGMRVGTTMRLTFTNKEDLKDKNGKKTGKTAWRVRLQSKRDGTGDVARDLLNRSAAAEKLRAAGGDEDAPF